MPHAVSPPPSSPPVADDADMSEAPAIPFEDGADETTETPKAEEPEPEAEPVVKEEPQRANLDDMFDDDDDDDDEEFSLSAQTRADKSSQEDSKPTSKAQSAASDPGVLRVFYQRLFPFRYLFQWLNHSPSPSPDFINREFAFVLPNDAYIRYQSFLSADLFRKQCVQMTPVRFEIGPQYSTSPRDRKTLRNASAFKPVAKELVFDIDMTDYDEIRTCCQGAAICEKCWTFITMAIKVVDAALREDFGFKHILWVYSGRRGAHAWVSDKRARMMDDNKRRAIAGYLELLKTANKNEKKVNVKRPLHPHLERSLNLLNPHFLDDVLVSQDPWSTPTSSSRLLQLLPDKKLVDALQKKWDSSPHRSSAQKWSDIDALASSGNLSTLNPTTLVEAKQDIRLEYTYPRLDAEVSKKLNHLLKSPFVVHPGTGRVCVPINVRDLAAFDPLEVPTIQTLLAEIDAWESVKGEEGPEEERERMQDWQKTSLRPYVEYFRTFVNGLLKEEMSGVKRERDEVGDGMDF